VNFGTQKRFRVSVPIFDAFDADLPSIIWHLSKSEKGEAKQPHCYETYTMEKLCPNNCYFRFRSDITALYLCVADMAFARSLEGWAVEPIDSKKGVVFHNYSCFMHYTLHQPPGLAGLERLPWTCCPDAPQHTPGSKETPV
jgi:hypothetical protein